MKEFPQDLDGVHVFFVEVADHRMVVCKLLACSESSS